MDQNNRYDRQIRLPYIDHAGQEKARPRTRCHSRSGRARYGGFVVSCTRRSRAYTHHRQRHRRAEQSSASNAFDESDVGRSKADAACEHLGKNKQRYFDRIVARTAHGGQCPALLGGADIVIDASDNFEARKIINNCCVPRGIPWIYGGVVQSQGMTMNIVPGGPCFLHV